MSSRDLVGRPLVPYFDAEENVNAALEVDASAGAHEQLEVDARVWNKELGYFEYPSEPSAAAGSSSTPIAIPAKGARASTDASKLLLTPAMMLSTSCPEGSTAMPNGHSAASASVPAGDGAPARSSSTKRGSKQAKGRSATPNARSQSKQQVQVTGPLGVNGKSGSGSDSSAKGSSGGGRKSRGKGAKDQSGSASRSKKELSAEGKWAWSAFQSSPDPTQLPLPPFLAKPTAVGPPQPVASLPPPPLPEVPSARAPDAVPPEHVHTQAGRPIPPFQPPLPPTPPPPEAPMSIELSMTQDLRRMLNIGGG